MDFFEVVRKRRSVRSYLDEDVSEEEVRRLLEAAILAPSAGNLQPWEFIVVRDKETKSKIREIAESAKQEVISADGPKWVKGYNMAFLEDAPVLIVVLVDPSRSGLGRYFGQRYGAIQAASACIQNMMLASADMGLGTLWFTFFRPEKLRPVLNIPQKLEIAGIVPLGIPEGEIKAPPRKEAKIYNNLYTD